MARNLRESLLVRPLDGSQPATYRQDRFRPDLGVHEGLGAVSGKVVDQQLIPRSRDQMAEDQSTMKLRGAVEVQGVELVLGDFHGGGSGEDVDRQ